MPNRIVREGFVDSEAIDRLSDAAECLFHRLLLVVDDAGRFDGRGEILQARLFPLKPNRSAAEVLQLLSECKEQDLVQSYQVQGKPYVQVSRWQRSGKTEQSRYPDEHGSFRIAYTFLETRDGGREFVTSSLPHWMIPSVPQPARLPFRKAEPAPLPEGVVWSPEHGEYMDAEESGQQEGLKVAAGRNRGDGPSSNKGRHEAPGDGQLLIPCIKQGVAPEEKIYQEYPKKVARQKALAAIRKSLAKMSFDLLIEKTRAFSKACAGKDPQFIPFPASWFNQERYLDEPIPETSATANPGQRTRDWSRDIRDVTPVDREGL